MSATATMLPRRQDHHAGFDVLVVDDALADKLLLSMAVQDSMANLNLGFVSDGLIFLDVLAERVAMGKAPDIVVLDHRMPRCTGLEAMEKVRASEAMSAVPVVMLTTSNRIVDACRAAELGVVKYVVKPGTYDGMIQFAEDLAELAAQYQRP
jgi:CheY-like chemotaxis protein